MWRLALLALADSLTTTHAVPVAPAETLAVTVSGEGRPIIFVPGLVGSAFGFRHVTSALADDGYQTVVVEPLGVGRSGRPRDADYSLTAQADRVAAVLDSLGLRDVAVVAHAVSGSIAYRLALRRPELVSGILSIEGGVAESAVTPGLKRALKFAPLIKLLGRKGLTSELAGNFRASSGDPAWITPDVIAGYTEHAARDVGATVDALKGMARSHEPWALGPELARLRCPVRLLLGGAPHKGAVPQAEVARLAASVADLEVSVVSGAGHFVFEERPGLVAAAVRALIDATPIVAQGVRTPVDMRVSQRP